MGHDREVRRFVHHLYAHARAGRAEIDRLYRAIVRNGDAAQCPKLPVEDIYRAKIEAILDAEFPPEATK
jgi:hypothetical protein